MSESASDTDWVKLTTEAELDEVDRTSGRRPVLRFKHSTRCGVSSLVLDRFRRNWRGATPRPLVYFLDLLAHRALSNAIEKRYAIEHESPQLLLVHQARCVSNWSHGAIDFEETQRAMRDRQPHPG